MSFAGGHGFFMNDFGCYVFYACILITSIVQMNSHYNLRIELQEHFNMEVYTGKIIYNNLYVIISQIRRTLIARLCDNIF